MPEFVVPAESRISAVRISRPDASQNRSRRSVLSVAEGFVIASARYQEIIRQLLKQRTGA